MSVDLKAPFPVADIDYRIGASTQDKSKGMLVFYIDARAVMDRLDAYCQETGGTWWDSYAPLADGKHIECQLTVQMPDSEGNLRAITRCDVGEPSEGLGDTLKGAYSDGLKRAAVKFGIGRYLYALGETWVPIGTNAKGNAVLTQASHQAARRYYIDRIGAAGEAPQPAQERAGAAEQPRADEPDDGIADAARTAKPTNRPKATDLSAFWAEVRGKLKFTPEQVATIAGADVTTLNAERLMALLEKLRKTAQERAA